MNNKRACGILLHITSLPSSFGIGDLGPGAYNFADFLYKAKQSFWQVLPLNPTDPAWFSSPYSSSSSFAGYPLLISPELMIKDGLLTEDDLLPFPNFPKNRVTYQTVSTYKEILFSKAYENFERIPDKQNYESFCSYNAHWLCNFALFRAIKNHFGGKCWGDWPQDIRDRNTEALKALESQLSGQIEKEKFLQYIFFKQWFALKHYCNEKDIKIIGDIPIYVNYDSVDAWTRPEIFKLDEAKRPIFVSGVPPDYFSKTGQLWGNPVYNWDVLRQNGYDWWIQKMKHNLGLFDCIRIDHFRGFVAYWEVPANEKTAINGRWINTPAEDFFNTLLREIPNAPIIAEDLGIITQDVRDIMNRFGFPGMRILQFAFGDNFSKNLYLPHNHIKNCVVYTGTHDNNTLKGWFKKEASTESKNYLFRYIGRKLTERDVNVELVRLAMMSVANLVIIPMQDIVGLGIGARFNIPATTKKNWQWRLSYKQLSDKLSKKLQEMTETYGRA